MSIVKSIFTKILNVITRQKLFVIIDPEDNSVTLSKALFKHMKNNAEKTEEPNIFVFKIKQNGHYAFCINPELEQPTQLCTLQYNDKYKCVGFESLCPSVGQIIYDYNLKHNKTAKLKVSVKKNEKFIFYQIEKT